MEQASTLARIGGFPSKAAAIALALGVLGLVAWLDYATGYEISVYALYTLPIAWVVWVIGMGWGVAFSLIASVGWAWADFADHHTYLHPWIRWERGVMNFIVFVFVAFSFARFKQSLASKHRKMKELKGILPICIACNRINDAGGHWVELDRYLREHSEAQPEPRLCPECSGSRYR